MSLYGAIQSQSPGKKMVWGSAAVTAALQVDLSDELTTIDGFQITYQTPPAAGNAFASAVIVSVNQLGISCKNSSLATATTAATIQYVAWGDAPR